MAIYITLINWTEQGIRNVKDSPARADAARALAKKLGANMRELYMTMGGYDLVAIMEAPDDETMAKFALTVGSGGAIRTTTLKAFDEATYRKIIAGL
jgi:uncharacterized protein with GYD domain